MGFSRPLPRAPSTPARRQSTFVGAWLVAQIVASVVVVVLHGSDTTTDPTFSITAAGAWSVRGRRTSSACGSPRSGPARAAWSRTTACGSGGSTWSGSAIGVLCSSGPDPDRLPAARGPVAGDVQRGPTQRERTGVWSTGPEARRGSCCWSWWSVHRWWRNSSTADSCSDRWPRASAKASSWSGSPLLFATVHFRPIEIPGLFVIGLVFGVAALRTGRLGHGDHDPCRVQRHRHPASVVTCADADGFAMMGGLMDQSTSGAQRMTDDVRDRRRARTANDDFGAWFDREFDRRTARRRPTSTAPPASPTGARSCWTTPIDRPPTPPSGSTTAMPSTPSDRRRSRRRTRWATRAVRRMFRRPVALVEATVEQRTHRAGARHLGRSW